MKGKLALILILSLIWSCFSNAQNTLKVIGFYRGNLADVNKYEVEKLTHIIFCFTRLIGNKISFEKPEQEKILTGLVELKKQNPKLKVLVSFGGWGGCETCSDIFSSVENRRIFAGSVRDFLTKYKVDGFDVDWESPVIGGFKDHKASPQDKDNFTELIKELRKTLPKGSELCFDANSFKGCVDISFDWKAVMQMVDWVNLMTYGLPANRSGYTGHHTALYSSPVQDESVDSGVKYLDSIGVPSNKIVIGAAFYSFVVENVDSLDNGLGRPGKFKNNIDYDKLLVFVFNNKDYKYYWDAVTQSPFYYNKKTRTFITLDDVKSVQLKTQYAIKHKLGGIMFWRLNGDTYKDGLLNAIYQEKVK